MKGMGYGHEEHSGFKRQNHSDQEDVGALVKGRFCFGRDGREQ